MIATPIRCNQFDVELPLPPSLNNAYANHKGGRHKTASYARWQADALEKILTSVPQAKRIGGAVNVSILLPERMRGDIDNRIKPILDALVASKRIDDDRNVVSVSAAKKLLGLGMAFVSVTGAAA